MLYQSRATRQSNHIEQANWALHPVIRDHTLRRPVGAGYLSVAQHHNEIIRMMPSTYTFGAVSVVFMRCPLSTIAIELRTILAIWISTDVRPQVLQNVFSSITISEPYPLGRHL